MVPRRRPAPDPRLGPFDGGVAELRRGGEVRGHLSTTVSTSWSPGRPLARQWWVWFEVAWSDGVREVPVEDYRRGRWSSRCWRDAWTGTVATTPASTR